MSDQSSIDDIIKQAQNGDAAKEESKAEPDVKDSGESSTRLSPNKIIDRLDDVTIQSEAEASKVVDLIDEIMTKLKGVDKCTKEIRETAGSDDIDKNNINELLNKIDSTNSEVSDMLFNAMNLLQYQDVLRQKIEKIAAALTVFYDYLGEFLGRGKKDASQRAVGKNIEDSTLDRDQKLDEINDIIKGIKNS